MDKKTYAEKINIGVPNETGNNLRWDAELFDLCKGKSNDINMNDFLNRLIAGYSEQYVQEKIEKTEKIKEIIKPNLIMNRDPDAIAQQIMEAVGLQKAKLRKEKHSLRLPLKTNEVTQGIVYDLRTKGVSVSQHFCDLFLSYCEKPIYERERIIFRDTVRVLEEACGSNHEIAFVSTSNSGTVHNVIPYKLVVGNEGMGNYLLCQEYNKKINRLEAMSYRLCLIRNKPWYTGKSGSLDPEIITNLEKTKKESPQYAFNDDTDICVKLTPKGQNSYRRIYYARPPVDRDKIEMLDDGNAVYHFNTSWDFVFRYFIRFKAGEAEVISPPEFRELFYRHFRDSVIPYEKE